MPPRNKPEEPVPDEIKTIDRDRLAILDVFFDDIATKIGFSYSHVQVVEPEGDYVHVVVTFVQLRDPKSDKRNMQMMGDDDDKLERSRQHQATPTRKRVS